MNVPGRPWPKDFPKVTTLSPYRDMKNHPDYVAAKTGDYEAAVRFVNSLLDSDASRALKSLADKYPGAVLAGIHAIESGGKNEIPHALTVYIKELTGLEADDDILQSNIVGHTGAGQNVRLFNRPKFEGEVKAGRNYIIVDDMVTMGSTLGELRNYIEHNGGIVVDMITLSTQHENNKTIALGGETKIALEKTFGVKSDEGTYDMMLFSGFLEECEIYGGCYEALTESEARALLSSKGLDEARNRRAKAGQKADDRVRD
jgi:hypothetical protein